MKIGRFIENSLILPTLFTAEALEARLSAKLRAHGLSITEAIVLLAVFFEERECRPSELARTLGIGRPRLSQALSKLAEKAFVQRKLESADARFVSIKLTSPGRSTALKLVSIFDGCNSEIETALGVKKAEQTAASLAILSHAIR